MATPIPSNHCAFTLAEVAAATGGAIERGAASTRVEGVSTDTRMLGQGSLFVALRGETHDGHAHLAAARTAGAAAALIARDAAAPEGMPVVRVADTLAALGALAHAHAERVRAKGALATVALTGSAGKTTTKELLAAAVRAHFGPTLATRGNLNNLVGVPMTLLALTPEHRAMVIECGTNARGEIEKLGAIVAPDVGLVLNADAGHTAGIGTVEDVAREKGAMFAAARRVAIGNADDPVSIAQITRGPEIRWSFGEAPDVELRLLAREILRDGRARLTVAVGSSLTETRTTETVRFELGLLGHAAAIDAVAALAAALALLGRAVNRAEIERAARAFATVEATAGRLSPRPIGDWLVLDDTYNANPRSVRASLATAAEIARGRNGRLVVALGDMLELGELAGELHTAIGADVAQAGAAVLVTFGPAMALAARAAAALPSAPEVVEASEIDDAVAALRVALRPGDTLLVKGSRGMRMERVIDALALATRESTA